MDGPKWSPPPPEVNPNKAYKEFIAKAAGYGFPVKFMKFVGSHVNIVNGGANEQGETDPRDGEISLRDKIVENMGEGPKALSNAGIGTIVHESVHAYFVTLTNDDQTLINADRDKHKKIVADGTKYYTDAPLEGGDKTSDPARLFQEAAASYVEHRVVSWWSAFDRLSIVLAQSTPNKAAIAKIAKQYDNDMAETKFGYSMEGGFMGIGASQKSTTKDISVSLRIFLDSELLEGKIENQFSSMKGFVKMITDAKQSMP